MNGIPKTPEEFQIWMVEKVGEIHTTQAVMNGKLDVSISEHRALEQRVSSIERDNRSARYWENGKILALLLLQAAGKIFVGKHS
jgi:hypothetical protein